MIALDTNILVGWFAEDDEAQTAQVDRLIDELSPNNPGFINLVVIAELFWVLRRALRLPADQIHDVIDSLLASSDIEVEDEETVDLALQAARDGADFSDALIAVTSELYGCAETVTFDRKAARRFGWRLLA